MNRCIDLAKLGGGYAAPNPMVGAVLVYENTIIGEGYHEVYGGPHAEVHCIQSVSEENKYKIPHATLYVSLEPCAHYGKTPPCTELIISNGIKKVVVGTRDPFPAVNGKGIEKLREHGIEVVSSVLETECRLLNKRFFSLYERNRPYIILKWAQSSNLKIAGNDDQRLMISNDFSNRLVHKWRSEEASILVGTNTALLDDPALTTRLWSGRHPIRLVLDMDLKLPSHLKLFNRKASTVIFNAISHEENSEIFYFRIDRDMNVIRQIIHGLKELSIQSVMVEGGAMLLQSFIDEGIWDEIRTITNNNLIVEEGLEAPTMHNACLVDQFSLQNDTVSFYHHT
ncbi:MAG: bifunctional diaminohydroxyphosphoribosylaminopyrimidine deaminase/5-amino-6-(5-phosphoribosylamino)uracil reductase RibD [Chitinophagaceae bacterium]